MIKLIQDTAITRAAKNYRTIVARFAKDIDDEWMLLNMLGLIDDRP
jgi:hypothetical protein